MSGWLNVEEILEMVNPLRWGQRSAGRVLTGG